MMEQKIRFTVLRIKYEDNIKDTCKATIMVKEGNESRTIDIMYTYMQLELGKEYEAYIGEEIGGKAFRVKQISEINNISTFIKETLASDRNISYQIKEHIMKEIGEEQIECLTGFSGEQMEFGILTEVKAKYISEKAKKYAELLGIREYCILNKIPEITANMIYKDLGSNALEVISHNPYLLSDYGVRLKIVDGVAIKVGLAHNNLNRVKCAVTGYLKYSSEKFGHVFVSVWELIEKLNEYMVKYGGFLVAGNIANKVIEEAIDELKAEGNTKIYSNENGQDCLYKREFFEYEIGIADIISKKLLNINGVSEATKERVESFISNYADGDKTLTPEQAQAVRNALTENVSILHGFPGTGKTETLRAIVNCINDVYKEANIEVVAFTGKAVAKVNEVLPEGTSARTIHRFLGLIKGKEFIPQEKEIDFLIIEESTMVNMKLFYYILQSINKNTRILMLGDECQLSSIGAGEIFINLIQSNLIKKVKLTKIFRQGEGSTIIKNIHKMAKGIGFSDENGLKCKKGEFELIDLKKESDITEKVKKTVDKLINEGHKLHNIQILSAVKEHEGGTKNLNKIVQDEFNPNPRRAYYNIVVGDKVMQNVNNYNKDTYTFNGEMGMVVKNEDDNNGRRTIVKYRDKTVEYKTNSIKELDPAFAITIHKSQGSEFNIVILCLLKSHKDIIGLNMLYTACSRAKKQLVIIAAADTFDTAIKKVQAVRNSNLVEMILSGFSGIEGRTA
ncbi:MAG TPA: AAA family ATPase [Clostridium sp.]|uniref:AAA family ATPase n=1 Tax=Clostridium sp. TaxID=1506 RepID=UPI002F9288EB